MQTAFNGASPGRNVRRRIDAPGIRDDDILLEGESTGGQPHGCGAGPGTRNVGTLSPGPGPPWFLRLATFSPPLWPHVDEPLLSLLYSLPPGWRPGGPGRGFSKPDLLKLARQLAFYFLTRSINRQVGLHLV